MERNKIRKRKNRKEKGEKGTVPKSQGKREGKGDGSKIP